jgi:hypothetical protein
LYLQRLSKVSLRSSSRSQFFRLHHYIINVGFDVSSNLIFQDDVHTFLIYSSPIFQPEGHLGVAENPKWHDKRCFLFVVCSEADLMITRIHIQKRQGFTGHRGIHNLTNMRLGVLIFWTYFIQTCIIDTHESGSIRFFYKNGVC